MNVNDMEKDEGTVPCKLTAIFEKQRSLMDKYESIEKANGLLQTDRVPVDIHSREGQARLKDFAWRITEELGEATAAYEDHPENVTHFQEEIMDALHFMVEALILCGITPFEAVEYPSDETFGQPDLLDYLIQDAYKNGVISSADIPDVMAYAVVHCLGRAMNCLKNKPWKTTHMLTDVKKFKQHMTDAFAQLILFSLYAGLDSNGIYEMYTKKNKVNQFRQRSQY